MEKAQLSIVDTRASGPPSRFDDGRRLVGRSRHRSQSEGRGISVSKELEQLQELQAELDAIGARARNYEERCAPRLRDVHPRFRESARNLVHYVAFRHTDQCDLQDRLASVGISSLTRIEQHTLASVQTVRRLLSSLLDTEEAFTPPPGGIDVAVANRSLEETTNEIFGAAPDGRLTRIMVTLPSDAAEDYGLVRDLLAAGMDIARINCARNDSSVWRRSIENLQRAQRELQRECRVLIDLAGAKLRTGPIEPGLPIVSWRPARDELGQVTVPARIWLGPIGAQPPASTTLDATLPLPADWLDRVSVGDVFRFFDIRGKARSLTVVARDSVGLLAESQRSAYVESGTLLVPESEWHAKEKARECTVRVGVLPPTARAIVLQEGDDITLCRDLTWSRPAVRDSAGRIVVPAQIAYSAPCPLTEIKVGEPVVFDDGKIEGVVRSVSASEVHITVTRAKRNGSNLKSERGINFPESQLHHEGLTEKDLRDLDFAVHYADMIALSFVNNTTDVTALQDELRHRGGGHLGILLKIETARAFHNFPRLLLAAMRTSPVGVIIARGDLAVECGWERLADLQEALLELCEAAHVPVVWATQVLDRLAKKGVATRAEVTDAAISQRAECVMLGKGPYVCRAIRTLDDILRRTQTRQSKKTTRLRVLDIGDPAM